MATHGKAASATATKTSVATAVAAISRRDKERTAGDEAATAFDPIYELKFDALRSALYHGAREHWLSLWHRLAIGSGLLAGATAIASAKDFMPPGLVVTIGAIVSAIAILDLVFDWGGMARLHVRLRERFYGILAEIEQADRPERDVKRFRARLAESYQEEPAIYHALNELMWNRTYEALSEKFDRTECRHVGGVRRFFAHIWPQRGHQFGTMKDNAA